MLILVCGGDGVGKTTLCKKLAEYFKFEYKHFDKPESMEDARREYYSFIDDVTINEKNVVCDRIYDGEYVYAPIYRKYMPNYLEDIEQKILNQVPAIRVYVEADLNTVLERCNKRGEDFVLPEDHWKIQKLYRQFMLKQRLPYVYIDTSEKDEKESVDYVITQIVKYITSDLFKTDVNKINTNNNTYLNLWGNVDGKYVCVDEDHSRYNKIMPAFSKTEPLLINLLDNFEIMNKCLFVPDDQLKIVNENKNIIGPIKKFKTYPILSYDKFIKYLFEQSFI